MKGVRVQVPTTAPATLDKPTDVLYDTSIRLHRAATTERNTMTDIQETIIRQMRGEGISPKQWVVDGDSYVKAVDVAIVPVFGQWHEPKGRSRSHYTSVEVTYNRGRDLYDVVVHKISRRDYTVETHTSTDVYADGIRQVIECAFVKVAA